MMVRPRKYLSPIANDVVRRCAETLNTSVDSLVEDFDSSLKAAADNYSKRLVEFSSSKAIETVCRGLGEKISDASFSRFTYDMMLAWETPSSSDSETPSSEIMSKEIEDKKEPLEGNPGQMHDDIPLFYSDIMPFLVNEEQSAGEDAFVWLASLLPLVADVVNARFTFETLTAPTASRLHFPAYDRYLREIHQCIKNLQKQSTPTGVELAEDEFILHVEGTARTQRVVRHIGTASWPGRLTLTNKALYFEASGVISYEDALKMDLSKADVEHQVKAAATGPWGAPLFDKAISYESPMLPEPVVLEFPEMTSSTRRDHWLTLVKEIVLLHRFFSEYGVESPIHAWEMQARTILGIVRLHAAREMMRIAPPAPNNFLIFSLYDDLPKGDYVLTELANNLRTTRMSSCTATSILKSLDVCHPFISGLEVKEQQIEEPGDRRDALASLETTIDQVREEAKEVSIAKATVEDVKDEGISDSLLVLMELLSSFKLVLPWSQWIVSWERPPLTMAVLSMAMLIIYREWVGYAMALALLMVVGFMCWARRKGIGEECRELLVCTYSDKTTVENIVAAQHSLKNLHENVKAANITLLKLWSILIGKAPKQANMVMLAMTGVAAMLVAVPFKYVLMGLAGYGFVVNSKTLKGMSNEQGNRRLKEWWESIPIVPVRTVGSTF